MYKYLHVFKTPFKAIIVFYCFTSLIVLIALNKNMINNGKYVPRAIMIEKIDSVEFDNAKNISLTDEQNSSNQQKRDILIVTKNQKTEILIHFEKIFYSTRIKFRMEETIDYNSTESVSLIIFETYADYLSCKEDPRFFNYLQENKLNIMIFNYNFAEESRKIVNIEFKHCQLNSSAFMQEVLHITKLNTELVEVNKTMSYNPEFKNLFFNEESISLFKCGNLNTFEDILFLNTINGINHMFVSLDSIDCIWLMKLLFLDSIRYLTNGEIDTGLDRYVQVDIDDIFVSDTGKRMIPEDVQELIRLQDDLSKNYFYHDGYKFKFVIAFSGYHYQTGNNLENEADRLLIGDYFFFNTLFPSAHSIL